MRRAYSTILPMACAVACANSPAMDIQLGSESTTSDPAADTGGLEEESDNGSSDPPPKILLVIADDFGVDSTLAYADDDGDGEADDGRSYAPTPTIHRICHGGRRFTNVWSQSFCSPTRASILTGRYAFRTGVGAFTVDDANSINPSEQTLPQLLDAHATDPFRHASFGKWHLGATEALGEALAPNQMGWQHFSGLLEGVLPSYVEWPKTVNGETTTSTRYATSDNVDDALAWLETVDADEGWLLWLAFAAPHTPYHLPPKELHSQSHLSGESSDILESPLPYFHAMVEAMDSEIDRLLQWLAAHGQDENLHIIFVGDNGTDTRVVQSPFTPAYAKPTLFEGGLRVPLCIRGPSVSGFGESAALAHVVDLLPTMLELAGVEASKLSKLAIDGRSLVPQLGDKSAPSSHKYLLSEVFNAFDVIGEGKAIRDATRKLIRFEDGRELYFDLQTPLWQEEDLLEGPLSNEELEQLQELRTSLSALLDSSPGSFER